MDNGPGWLPDPQGEAQERYWSGSAWTDRVRPAGRSRSMHLPEHVPELQRALAAATADIDEVEDRLSTLFERTDGAPPRAAPRPPAAEVQDPLDDAFRDADAEAAEGGIGSEDEVDTAPVHPEVADPSGDGTTTTRRSRSSMPPWQPRSRTSPRRPRSPDAGCSVAARDGGRQSKAVTRRASSPQRSNASGLRTTSDPVK